MTRKITLCLVTFLFTLITNLNCELNVGDSCETSQYEQGICVNISKCPSFTKILHRQPISHTDREYLNGSICRKEGNTIIICCPDQIIPDESSKPSEVSHGSDNLQNHPSIRLLPEKTCGITYLKTVIRGNQTLLGEFPWLALLGFKHPDGRVAYYCGGTLINSRYIITAAHCTTNTGSYVLSTARLGEHDQATNPDCEILSGEEEYCAPEPQDIKIEQIIRHQEYNRTRQYNDIAILRLEQNVNFNDYVRPICFPYESFLVNKSYVNERLTIAGWGSMRSKEFSSTVKLTEEVTIQDINQCREQYQKLRTEIFPNQICAASNDEKAYCVVESGAPLMSIDVSSYDQTLRYYAAGIVTFGPKVCNKNTPPSVYTRIGSFAKWILDNLKE